jgi:hypothetical protein
MGILLSLVYHFVGWLVWSLIISDGVQNVLHQKAGCAHSVSFKNMGDTRCHANFKLSATGDLVFFRFLAGLEPPFTISGL